MEKLINKPIYSLLGIEITLRCNGYCKNCKVFCCSEERTGLNYDDLDMTIPQIEKFIKQTKKVGDETKRIVFDEVVITGGEATIHPLLKEITLLIQDELLGKYINRLKILTNNILNVVKADKEIKKYFFNWVPIDEKSNCHWAVLIHPDDSKQERPNLFTCRHLDRDIVLSAHGYNICCSAEGYIRLFGEEDLFIDELPNSIEGFPLQEMNEKICRHCATGCKLLFLEKDVGSPMSSIYTIQAELNRQKNRITKRF